MNRNNQKNIRRRGALERLYATINRKWTKTADGKKKPLTEADTRRINKEIQTLKTRIV